MKNTRHNGRNDDTSVDFASPDRRGDERSAFHRYIPAQLAVAVSINVVSVDEEANFEASDFRARWWPAPDLHD